MSEGYDGWGGPAPSDVMELRQQLALIEKNERLAQEADRYESERKFLRDKIKNKGHKPCA